MSYITAQRRMSHTALILPVCSRQSCLSSQPYLISLSSPRRAYPSPRASAKGQANELNNLAPDDLEANKGTAPATDSRSTTARGAFFDLVATDRIRIPDSEKSLSLTV
ncbi:hypothetical protein V8E54_006556 [Elaphomyces granulatus]